MFLSKTLTLISIPMGLPYIAVFLSKTLTLTSIPIGLPYLENTHYSLSIYYFRRGYAIFVGDCRVCAYTRASANLVRLFWKPVPLCHVEE